MNSYNMKPFQKHQMKTFEQQWNDIPLNEGEKETNGKSIHMKLVHTKNAPQRTTK